MKNVGKTLLNLMSAFIAGAAIGTLFAPEKGDQTRKRIAKRGKEMLSNLENALDAGKDNLDEVKYGIKDNIQSASQKLEKFSKNGN